jgi:hypothetical protein
LQKNYTWFAWGGTHNISNDTSSNLMSTLLRSLWKRQKYICGIELLQWFKILWRKYSTKSSLYDMVNIKKKICVYCFAIKKNHNYGKQKNNISKVSYSIYTNKEIPFFCTKNNIFKNKNCLSNCLDQVLLNCI